MPAGDYLLLMLGGYALTAAIETAVLLAGLSRRHPVKVRLFAYRHNLVPVLAYWPVLLGSLLVGLVTFVALVRSYVVRARWSRIDRIAWRPNPLQRSAHAYRPSPGGWP